jgi:PhzF family phenazine biosynthesis protein
MDLTVHFIDSFTETAFNGNPAAVIITNTWLSDSLMQSIAVEHNLSETAFVKHIDEQHYQIRWFSPITEIDFCGHATLAAAFVIFKQHKALEQISFFAKAVGDIVVTAQENGYMQMCFPNNKPKTAKKVPEALQQGLSIAPSKVLVNGQAYFVVYEDEAQVKAVITNNNILAKLAPLDVVVTAKSQQYDFISRYFWPANGGDEDPVTGSIHSGLAPFWAEQLHKTALVAYQASKRGGTLLCEVTDKQVYVSGKATQYLEGTISLTL